MFSMHRECRQELDGATVQTVSRKMKILEPVIFYILTLKTLEEFLIESSKTPRQFLKVFKKS